MFLLTISPLDIPHFCNVKNLLIFGSKFSFLCSMVIIFVSLYQLNSPLLQCVPITSLWGLRRRSKGGGTVFGGLTNLSYILTCI